MRYYIIFLLLVIFPITSTVYAQRYTPGQKSFQFTGGLVNGFNFQNSSSIAYSGGIAYTTSKNNCNHWVLGGEYLYKPYEYRNIYVPVSQFTGEATYYMNFFSDKSKTFFLSFGITGLAGYESVNWGNKTLYDGSTITSEDAFIYGGGVALELESYVSDNVILLVYLREKYTHASSVGKYHTLFGLGLKFTLN